jgi:hypothetical protein
MRTAPLAAFCRGDWLAYNDVVSFDPLANREIGAYEGRVEIAAKGDGYNLKWTVGGRTYVGVALREGDVLSVA